MTTIPARTQPAGSTAQTGSGPSPRAAATVGERVRHSDAIGQAIRSIVSEVSSAGAAFTDAQPPRAELKESYDALMARSAAVRGRPLLYPFLGSGAGRGALVELLDGSVKWDMISGIGVHFFGHGDPDLTEAALWAGLDDTVKHGNLQSGFEPYRFLEVLIEQTRRASRLTHGYIATGGAMANENALKVCLQKRFVDQLAALRQNADLKPEQLLAKVSSQPRVIAFQDCFMGRSLVMANVGDSHAGREGLPGGLPVDYMPFWDPHAAERMGPGAQGKKRFIDMAVSHLLQYVHRYPGAHACFIFELVQGEGGFNVGDRDYFLELMKVCKAHGIAVWDDEIQTFGRTERMFAYEHFDLGDQVDVFCVGKMTQACATLWTPEFNPRSAILSGTFTGEGVSFRVGTRVLERLRDGDFYGPSGRFAKHHALFRKHALDLITRHPEWFPPVPALNGGGERLVGGLGGMMRFTPCGGEKEKILKAARAIFEEGVVLFSCGHGPYHVRMLPPLPVMQESDWPKVFACIERGMARI